MTVDATFEKFKHDIRTLISLDLNSYKQKQLRRRINQFMERQKTSDYNDFYLRLKKDDALLNRFRDHITINTSEFFRDIKVYETLKNKVIPDIAMKKNALKIWSAGCSIGAEAYSLAILMEEAKITRFRIDATDFDKRILLKAKEGKYAANLLKNLPPVFLPKYFDLQGDKYAVKTQLKKNIHFREHNLLKDIYPKDYDLILCRNVFIYFKKETQDQLLEKFSKSLKKGGYFVLGASEFISQIEKFSLIKKALSVYRKE